MTGKIPADVNQTAGVIMTHYRIYSLSEHGSIAGGTDVDCEDDKAAIAAASQASVDRAGMEIWSGCRLVAQIFSTAGVIDDFTLKVWAT